MELLQIENVSFRYPNSENLAIDNVSLTVRAGEFVVVCGQSGCGKTTLLKLIKRELAPAGELLGKIYYRGTETKMLDDAVSAAGIGFVLQNPDNQIVTDKVWRELAFGLENLGIEPDVIRRRVGEMASYFGLQDMFRKETDHLSGGQKQLMNLASIMVMQPDLLILDEPTSQLDPITASEFIATLQKLNRELGITILLTEHRLEEVLPIADKVVVMEQGRIRRFDTPKSVVENLPNDHPMMIGMPSAVRIYHKLNGKGSCPISVKEGREFLESNFSADYKEIEFKSPHSNQTAIELKDVWFRYNKDLPDILRSVSLMVNSGEHYCLLGGNGTGKTTLLNVISGLERAYKGCVKIDGKQINKYRGRELYRKKVALLPQDPQSVFLKDTVQSDLMEMLLDYCSESEMKTKISNISQLVGISHLLDKHPYDLSGGEQQKCALAKVLLSEPSILLLDEPTKGLDAHYKKTLINTLNELKSQGVCILTVTHDVEFAAESADRCALFFDGEIVSSDVPPVFFSQNNFYTTAANRIARGLYPFAVTCDDVAGQCVGKEIKKC